MKLEQLRKIAQAGKTDVSLYLLDDIQMLDTDMEFFHMAIKHIDALLDVVEAAKNFQISMTGEWPADKYHKLCNALKKLEEL